MIERDPTVLGDTWRFWVETRCTFHASKNIVFPKVWFDSYVDFWTEGLSRQWSATFV